MDPTAEQTAPQRATTPTAIHLGSVDVEGLRRGAQAERDAHFSSSLKRYWKRPMGLGAAPSASMSADGAPTRAPNTPRASDLQHLKDLAREKLAGQDLGFLNPRRANVSPTLRPFQVTAPEGFSDSFLGKWLYRPLGWLMSKTRWRFVVVSYPERLGHLVAELDALMREIALRREAGEKPIRPILLVPLEHVGAPDILSFWRRALPVITSETAWRALWPLLADERVTTPLRASTIGLGETITFIETRNRWGDRPPAHDLTDREIAEGRDALERLGVPRDAWYVCAHARAPGFSDWDDVASAFRNVDIETYFEAFDAIRARGGYVVRLGDPSMPKLPAMDGVVDYAHSDLQRTGLDLALVRACRFLLGSASGPQTVAHLFNKPMVQTNAAPLGAALGLSKGEITIPKLVVAANGKPAPFPFLFQSEVRGFRNSTDFTNAGVYVRSNTPDDIRSAVEEMIDRLDGALADDPDDAARQRRFRSLLRPGDYTYGSEGRVSRAFLAKHAHLL